MSKETFSQLRDEIQKFTGFRFPENVRSAANIAVSEMNASNITLPISELSNKIVKFIATLFENTSKFNQQQTLIFPRIIKSIENQIFVDDALDDVLNSFMYVANELDSEQAMQVLQLTTQSICNVFPRVPSIEPYLSIVFTMMANTNDVISSTAFAFFPQILQSLQAAAQSSSECVEIVEKKKYEEYLNYCSSKYGSIFKNFERPLNFIFYLIFSDLTNIALKQPTTWLRIKNHPTAVIYDLLELIVNQCKDMLLSEPQLICIFDGALIHSMTDGNALQFIIGFIDTFIESHGSLCNALFIEFLSRPSNKAQPLFFFRSIATRNVNLAARMFMNEDVDEENFVSLVNAVLILVSVEHEVPTDPIDFSLLPTRLKKLDSDRFKAAFTQNAPFEIVFGLLKSFANSVDKKMNNWAKRCSRNLFKVINLALKYSTLETFRFPCESLTDLLTVMRKCCELSFFDEVFQNICNVTIENEVPINRQESFQTFDKQGLYQRYLCHVAETYPNICRGKWLPILNSIFRTKTALSLNFAGKFEETELYSIVEAAIAICPLPFDFLATLITANNDRFSIIWDVLEPFFKFNLKEEKFDENVLNLFLELMSRCITTKTEESILSMAVRFVSPDSTMFIKNKDKVLAQLRQVLAENVNVIKSGWTQLFMVLQPVNFSKNANTIQNSFNVITLICNDHIQLVPQKSMQHLIELIFKFSDNDADINLSLSSFDLLWGVVRVMDNSPENWKVLMSEVLRLIMDNRNDVSQCAIRTFFSLMSSNFEMIPESVIDMFVSSTFAKILNCIDFKDPDRTADFELALQEMAHYTSTFWDKFNKNPDFKKKFIPLLIDKATVFCTECPNHELVTNAFLLYECLFQCDHLDFQTEEMLRESLKMLTKQYIKVEDIGSIIFSCFGRLMNRILSSLKTRNVIDTLPSWFPIIRQIVRNFDSPVYVHITPQRTLDIIPSLFPMPEEVGFEVIDLLVEFAIGNAKNALSEYIVNLMCKIFDKGVDKSKYGLEFLKKCKPLAMMRCSEPLMKLFLEAKIEFDESSAPEVFECYTTISKMWPSLQKLVDSALVLLIDRANDESQKKFVKTNSTNFETLELLWKTFFDPSSEKFNKQVYDNCFELTFNSMKSFLESSTNSDHENLVNLLNFLAESKIPPKKCGVAEPNGKWHLIQLMKPVLCVVVCDVKEVRFAAKAVLEQISDIFGASLC